MPKEKPPTRTVSVYLMRKHVRDAAEALDIEPNQLAQHQIRGFPGATLYVSTSPKSAPKWTEIFAEVADPPLALRRETFAAVLLLKANRRLFAIAFGSGRHLLKYAAYERNFGLQTALNLVDPDQIRSASSRTFVDTALQVRRQVAEPSDIVGLELDVQRDLLTSLEGTVSRQQLGKRVAGSDAARLTAPMRARDLGSICRNLYKASRETGYKKRYPWIDWISEVTDPDQDKQLTEEALGQLLAGEVDRFDVYPPEMISEEIVEYGTRRDTTVMEPTRQLLRQTIERSGATDPENLLEALRHTYIKAQNEEGLEVKRWSWWDCLYYEHRGTGGAIFLDRGSWYRVKRDEAKAVDDLLATLTPSSLNLPDAERAELEGHYNERVAEGASFRLLDRKLLRPIPGESPIEACDLFAKSGEMIQVKRRKGGSAGLSHLFAQAMVSSQLLVNAPKFAPQMRKALKEWGTKVKDPPRSRDHPVVLAVMLAAESSGEGARALPFFSKVFMRQNVQQLRAMGFKVHYDEIPAPLLP
jgi:uncharacterized protein (TIGR04141 family)